MIDEDRFRLVITITKSDLKGKIIRRMSQGIVIGYTDFQKAIDASNEFNEQVKAVLDNVPGRFMNYGLTCVVDQRDGNIHCTHCLQAPKDKVTG